MRKQTDGTVLSETLFRAAYCHGGIISPRRLAAYPRLLKATETPLVDAVLAVSEIPTKWVGGDVVTGLDGQKTPAFTIILAVCNMIAMYAIKTLEILIEGLDANAGDFDETLRRSKRFVLELRLKQSATLLPLIMRCDERWNFIRNDHIKVLRDLSSRIPKELNLEVCAVDFDSWLTHKRLHTEKPHHVENTSFLPQRSGVEALNAVPE